MIYDFYRLYGDLDLCLQRIATPILLLIFATDLTKELP